MSKTQRHGRGWERPAWNYIGANQDIEHSVLEMTESVRNTLESIRDSQMLQCDVAHAIKGLLREMKGLRRDLRAIHPKAFKGTVK